MRMSICLFQSTLSMRRATKFDGNVQFYLLISIHALHEESDHHNADQAVSQIISIHALHEESD